MRYKTLSVLAASAALAPFMAQAEGLSYTYVEAGYANTDIDEANETLGGWGLKGSFEITENIFVQGRYAAAATLCLAGVVIAVLDYVVRTIVVGEASKLHTLLTFFAVLGGIRFFGLVGIVAGPLVVAVSVALLESYRLERSGLLMPREES